jgi:hypothetical protein
MKISMRKKMGQEVIKVAAILRAAILPANRHADISLNIISIMELW